MMIVFEKAIRSLLTRPCLSVHHTSFLCASPSDYLILFS
jgi:hypothetical protein